MGVPNAGLAVIADRLHPNGSLNPFRYVQYGSDATAFAVTQTDLVAPITTGGAGRTLAAGSRDTTNTTNDTTVWEVSHTFTADHTLRETGIFTEAAAGDMGYRQVIGTLLVKNGQTLYQRAEMVHDQA